MLLTEGRSGLRGGKTRKRWPARRRLLGFSRQKKEKKKKIGGARTWVTAAKRRDDEDGRGPNLGNDKMRGQESSSWRGRWIACCSGHPERKHRLWAGWKQKESGVGIGKTQCEGPPKWSCAGITEVCSRQVLMMRGKETFHIPQKNTPKPNRFYLALIRAPISKGDSKNMVVLSISHISWCNSLTV